ncbi:MAG: SH3 domain-containing protein [Chloroflexota bacterium]
MHRLILLLCTFLVFPLTACSMPGEPSPVEQAAVPTPGIVIDRVSVEVVESGLKPEIQAMIFGHFTDSCTEIQTELAPVSQQFLDRVFYVSIAPHHLEDTDCSLPGGEFQLGVELEDQQLSAGEYFVDVHGVRSAFSLEGEASIDWETFNLISGIVREKISISFGVTQIDYLNVQQVTWGDSCLEIPLAGEACTAARVPGYLIIAGTGKQVWAYRSNSDGSLLLEDSSGGVIQSSQAAVEGGVLVSVLPEHYAVNVRYGPGKDYQVQGQLAGNASVNAVGISENGEWLQVVYLTDPYPYTLAWLYAPLSDYQPGDIELPLAASDAEKVVEVQEAPKGINGWVSEFLAGLLVQTQSELGLESARLETLVEMLVVIDQEPLINGTTWHNALYRLSLEEGLGLLYSPDQGSIFSHMIAPEGQVCYLVVNQPAAEGFDQFGLFRMSLDGGDLERITDLPDHLAGVQLSPDGRELLLIRESESTNFEMFKLGADGRGLTMFYLPGSVRSFDWSPDGDRIALALADETGSTDIYIVDSDGGGLNAVFVRTGMDQLGGWSPDGSQLVFSHLENGNQEIILLNLTTGETTNLSDYSFSDHDPVWSPDGRFVAYQSNRFDLSSSDSLMVWDSQTEKIVNLSRGIIHQTTFLVDWSPDSRYLLLKAEAGGAPSYYIVDLLNQGVYLLFGELLAENAHVADFSWLDFVPAAGVDQSIGEYWLVPVTPDMIMPAVEENTEVVIVTITEDMNVRAGPGIDYELVGELRINTRVEVLGKSWDGYWLKINYPRLGAEEVWIFTELTDLDPAVPLPVLSGSVIDLSAQQASSAD